jgi:hypothetical protein
MVESPIHHLLYASRAADGLGVDAIELLVSAAREANDRHDVTGFLLYSGTHFAQVIEGPRFALDTLMASIRRDRRHSDVQILLMEPAAHRDFGGWSMAYLHELGFGDLLETIWRDPKMSAIRARGLVEHFRAQFDRQPPS